MKSTTNTRFKTTLIMVAVLSLTACGGGGGGASTGTNGTGSGSGTGTGTGNGNTTPTPAPLNVTKQSVTSSLKENTSFSLTFAVSGAVGNIRVTDASVAAESTPVTGNSQVNGSTVTYVVNAGDAKLSGGQYAVSLLVADDSRSVKVDHVIAIENTSGATRAAELTALKAAASTYAALTEEKALFDKIGEVAKLVNPDYLPNEASLKDKFSKAITDAEGQSALTSWVAKADSALSGYAAGTTSEDVLSSVGAEVSASLNARANKANSVLGELFTYTTSVVPSLPTGKVFVGSNGATASQFEGNPALGSYAEGVWSYSSAYKFMTAITAPETNTCKAQ